MKKQALILRVAIVLAFLSNILTGWIAPQSASAAPTELFISEYIEGSSYNKAIEIYNGTGSAIDLAAGDYTLKQFTNGSSTGTLIFDLSGTVDTGDVFVAAHSSANAAILAQANQTTGASLFNGNDVVALYKGTDLVDVIGQIGFDPGPGTEWGTGLTSTADNTLVRKSPICQGDANGSNAFDPSTEWDGYATDTTSYLGSHSISCSDTAPEVYSVVPTDGASGVALNANLTVNFSEYVEVTETWFNITCDGSPQAATADSGPQSFTIDPTADLPAAALCTVTIYASQVADQDGAVQNMEEDYSWTFTTHTPLINEVVFNHVGSDTNEFVEIFGNASTDYSTFTLLQIEGDSGANPGQITSATSVGTTSANGYWTTGFQEDVFQNGTLSLLLVRSFSGSAGSDLDTDNDGVLDSTPWAAIADGVAISDSDAGDLTYAAPVLSSGFDGIAFMPGGASRIPNGTDTNAAADWKRNDFDGAGIPALDPGTPEFKEAYNTPGAQNQAVPTPLVINETDADTPGDDVLEFVELYDGGLGNTSLTGLVLVLYNGNGDISYAAFDLDGRTTDANGIFVLGNAGVTGVDLTFNANILQNGADAVALYQANGSDFPNGTAVTTANLLDAIVYDTSDADDAGLLILLNAGQPQVNENGSGAGDTQSNQRCPNGAGGTRNTDTYQQLAPTPDAANACGVVPEAAPGVSNTSPADGSSGVWVGTNIQITFSENVNVVSPWFSITCNSSNFTANVSGGPQVYTLDPVADLPENTTCTITVSSAQVTDQDTDDPPDNMLVDYIWSFTTTNTASCGSATSYIHTIQGSGAASSLVGTVRTIEGIVTGDYQDAGQLSGFFVQEEAGDVDADGETSEGVFVYSTSFPVSLGDKVRVSGTVVEYYGLTEINSVTSVDVCSAGNTLPDAITLSMPFPADAGGVPFIERYEGMLVTLPVGLIVSEVYRLGRGGEFLLSSGERLWQPTNIVEPGAPAIAQLALNRLNSISVDDGSLGQNRWPIIHPAPELSLTNRVRIGDSTAATITGVLTYSWSGWSGTDAYRIHPQTPTSFNPTNPRPLAPPSVSNNLKVASFNVLNYFNGPTFPTSRGADSLTEFIRQRDKILAALVALDADIIGLMEIENDGYGATSAIQDLVNGLNDPGRFGSGTYSFVNPGLTKIGTDEIAVGIIYKTASVSLVGGAAILDNSYNVNYKDDKNRPALAQTFQHAVTGEKFTLVVNHLKSKGSSCDTIGDPDTGDGQGNCNLTRTTAAQIETQWLATDPTGSGDPDLLVIGDMNAYALEDPIDAFKAGGYIDLIAAFHGDTKTYSYVFDGQSGYLDHALSSSTLLTQVTGVGHFHINTDEPLVFDYNTEYSKPPSMYSGDMYRASDHDAVVINLEMVPNNNPVYADADTVRDCGGNLPCFTSIQEAIQNVRAGGTVIVYPEIYDISVDIYKAVTINTLGNITVNSFTQSTGIFNAPTNGTLTIKGDFSLNGGTFNLNNTTIALAGAAMQTVGGDNPLTFNNLTINNISGGVFLSQHVTVNGTLILSSGLFNLGSFNLTLGAAGAFGGTPSVSAMIVPTGSGELRKLISSPASITFPVGDNDAGAEYSPVTLNFSAVTGTESSYVAVKLKDAAHSANMLQPRITRYWTITQSGLSNFMYDAFFTYTENDRDLGTHPESDLYAARWNGTSWFISPVPVNTAGHILIFDDLDSFSDFTGTPQSPTSVSLAYLQALSGPAWIEISWATLIELDTLGFNIYRADSPDGPRTLLTSAMIPCKVPGSSSGAEYSYVDTSAVPGVTYYYWIEIIGLDGSSWTEPVFAATGWGVYLPLLKR